MPSPTTRRRLCATVLSAIGALAAPAWAADPFPNRPIRIIVPYAPGGGTDLIARMLATRLAERVKVGVIVENRPGAGGVLGNDVAVKAQPDGYTVLLTTTAVIQQPEMMTTKLPYDFMRDMRPLTVVARGADLLMVPKDLPANSVAEFLALAKADPKSYAIGMFGNGTASHIHAALLTKQAGVDLALVPYKGASALITDLIGGQIKAGIVDFSSAQAHLPGGRIKALAASGATGSPELPNVPSFTQLGFKNFEQYGWFALFTQAATPTTVARRLADEFIAVVRMPDVRARLVDMGNLPGGDSAEDTLRQMNADAIEWARVIRETKIRVD